MGIELTAINAPDGTRSNMGGLTTKAWIIPIADVETDSVPAMNLETYDGTGLEKLVECAADFALALDKGFYPCYSTIDKAEYMLESQGEIDGKSFLGKVKLVIPGAEAKLHGLMFALNNVKCIVLVELNTGEILKVGTKKLPVNISASWNASTTGGEARAITLEGQAPMERPLHYTGTIVEVAA